LKRLLINPNTTQAVTGALATAARKALGVSANRLHGFERFKGLGYFW
jgi:hypothetical protein